MSSDAATASAAEIRDEIRRGDRRAIARTITLLESRRPDQSAQGQAILDELVPYTGGAIRVGITGPPGVGKSTFIEALGLQLIGTGRRVAVLAVRSSLFLCEPALDGLSMKRGLDPVSVDAECLLHHDARKPVAVGEIHQRRREGSDLSDQIGSAGGLPRE